MTRLILLVVLAAVAVGAAWLLQRRRPEPPSAPSYRAPTQVDRADFHASPQAVLVVVFGSATCNSCPGVWETVQTVVASAQGDGPGVETERFDVQDNAAVHNRYKIDGVPTTLVVQPDGVVTASFFGPFQSGALTDALTDPSARQPGGRPTPGPLDP